MSCIYGPHQFGTEDQGWVAHFLIRALEGQPITLYGDGMQVRDILFVDDLLDACLLAQAQMPKLSGQAFNIGGGPSQAVSLLELIDLIRELHGERPAVHFGDWRAGDQRYYVSDTRRFRAATGWKPQVSVRQGLNRLYRWLTESRHPAAAGPALGKGASGHTPWSTPAGLSRVASTSAAASPTCRSNTAMRKASSSVRATTC
jgi:CDP-paratose 2-epimerase